MIDRVHHENVLLSYTAMIRSVLEEWVDSIPALFADSAQARSILTDRYDRLCERMQDEVKRVRLIESNGAATGSVKKDPAKVKAARRRHSKGRRKSK